MYYHLSQYKEKRNIFKQNKNKTLNEHNLKKKNRTERKTNILNFKPQEKKKLNKFQN